MAQPLLIQGDFKTPVFVVCGRCGRRGRGFLDAPSEVHEGPYMGWGLWTPRGWAVDTIEDIPEVLLCGACVAIEEAAAD